jgi:hypothetical protein
MVENDFLLTSWQPEIAEGEGDREHRISFKVMPPVICFLKLGLPFGYELISYDLVMSQWSHELEMTLSAHERFGGDSSYPKKSETICIGSDTFAAYLVPPME